MAKIEVREPMRARTEDSEFLIQPLGKGVSLLEAKYKITKREKLVPATGGTQTRALWSMQGTGLRLEIGKPLRLGVFTSPRVVQAVEFVEPHH